MPIDGLPSEQAFNRLSLERIQETPSTVRKGIKAIGALFSGDIPGALDAFKDWNEDIIGDRVDYLFHWVIHDLKELASRYEELSSAQREYMETDWISLLADARQKAVETRARERIERIAHILTGSIPIPIRLPDETEEMMRIAMTLTDEDIVVLRAVAENHNRYQMRAPFTPEVLQAPTKTLGIAPERVLSVYGKLTSLGLIMRAQDRAEQLQAHSHPTGGGFMLLDRGRAFLQSVTGRNT